MTVDVSTANSTRVGPAAIYGAGRVSSNLALFTAARGMPVVVPASQLYFWSRRWQAGERDAERDRRSGDVRTFASSKDVISWLLSPDD